MKKLFSMSIRRQLLLIALVVALPAGCIIIYSGAELRRQSFSNAKIESQKLVDRIATEQQNLVAGAEQLMSVVARLPEVRNHDAAAVERILRELLKSSPMYSNIFIADREGTIWASAVTLSRVNVGDRRYFINARNRAQLSAGEFIVSRATSRPAINFAYPIIDARGDVTGVISVGFTLDRYRELLGTMHLPAGTSFVLIDHKGTILSRGIDPEPYIGKAYPSAPFRTMQEGPEADTAVRKGLRGDDRIISYRKVRLRGEESPYMYVTGGVPIEVALKRANLMLLLNGSLLTSFLAAALALAWVIGKRSIVDRFAVLEQASQRLAAGNLDVRVSDLVEGGELGRLGQTLDAMADQLAQREKALLKSEKLLSTIIETEPECVKLLAADGSILMMNRAGLDMVQAGSFADIEGKQPFPIIDPAFKEPFKSLMEEVFKGNSGILEFRLVGLKGRPLWVEMHAVPLRDDTGGICALLGITRNITERKEMDRMKDEMISAVSHEMRTPLTAMLGYTEFIIENEPDGDQVKEYLGIVLRESERLKELIDDFLDMQRLRARQGRENFRPLSIRPLLEEAARFFSGTSQKHRVSVESFAELPAIFGNEEDLQTVLNNLLSNAVKYSPDGGEITLGARSESGSVVFWVRDQGIGIDPDEQEKIFNRFYRVDNTARRTTSGTGLGLSLVREVVLMHGGRIDVESTVEKGSTFYVSLPTCQALLDLPPAVIA